MNWAHFKKHGLGMRVELEPRAWFLDEHGSPASLTRFDQEVARMKLDYYMPRWAAAAPI